jgi:hypothetical protein
MKYMRVRERNKILTAQANGGAPCGQSWPVSTMAFIMIKITRRTFFTGKFLLKDECMYLRGRIVYPRVEQTTYFLSYFFTNYGRKIAHI